jgi:L-seryl-tRNA(Ser) seleniumtransferase
MARAMRADAPTLAALTVTVELYAGGRAGEIPFWAMVALDADVLRRRLQTLLEGGCSGTIEEGASLVGAGSVPGSTIPSPVLVLDCPDHEGAWRRLLEAKPMPVVVRREAGKLVVDLRAVEPDHDVLVAAALHDACRS